MKSINRLLSKKQSLFLHRIFLFYFKHSEQIGLGLLAGAVMVSRWVGKSSYLYASDSGLYALALRHYDVSVQQPHPPGYPLYILFAKPIYWLTKDANLSLVVVSIVFSILSIYAVFYLAKKIYGAKVAWLSIFLLASAPLFWFHGQVALNYTSDVFFSALFARYIYVAVTQRKSQALLMATIILAIGGGFRPTLILFMLPLWLWGIWRQRNWRERWMAKGALIGTVLTWLIPMVYLSGGWVSIGHAFASMFLVKNGIYTESIFQRGLPQLFSHAQLIIDNLILNFGWASVLIVLLLGSFLVPTIRSIHFNYFNLGFWFVWLVPALIFYLVVIFTMPGYLLVILPVLVILTALAIVKLIDEFALAYTANKQRQNRCKIYWPIITGLILVGLNVFIYYRPDPVLQAQKSTHFTIKLSDQVWRELIPTVKREFSPQNTIIGIDKPFVIWGFSQFEYYFPEYPTYTHATWGVYNPDGKKWLLAYNQNMMLVDYLDIKPTDTKLIVIRGTWADISASLQQSITLANGAKLAYYDLTDQSVRELLNKIPDTKIYGVTE